MWTIHEIKNSRSNSHKKHNDVSPLAKVNAARNVRGSRDFPSELPFYIEFVALLSSNATDNSEIVSIDSNIDLGMFVSITKNMTVTIHSLQNGQ